MLGADYRIGRDETVYNDVAGHKPAYPSGGERLRHRSPALLGPSHSSGLPVGQSASGERSGASQLQPEHVRGHHIRVEARDRLRQQLEHEDRRAAQQQARAQRELERLAGHRAGSFQWVFEPDKRGEIRKRVLEWTINRVRYLQEHGYSQVGLATIPQKLYVREGPRIVGRDTYTVSDLRHRRRAQLGRHGLLRAVRPARRVLPEPRRDHPLRAHAHGGADGGRSPEPARLHGSLHRLSGLLVGRAHGA